MNKVFSVVLIGFLCFTLVGCTTNSNSGKENGGDDEIKIISNKIIEKLSATRKIVIKDYRKNSIKRTIMDENEIEKIVNIISRTNEETGTVTSEAHNWNFAMYDTDDKLIFTIYVWKSGYIGFKNEKEYSITAVSDLDTLIEIIEK